jgi:hypothetical protein
MNIKYTALIAALATTSTFAFTTNNAPVSFYRTTGLKGMADDDIESVIERGVSYSCNYCIVQT